MSLVLECHLEQILNFLCSPWWVIFRHLLQVSHVAFLDQLFSNIDTSGKYPLHKTFCLAKPVQHLIRTMSCKTNRGICTGSGQHRKQQRPGKWRHHQTGIYIYIYIYITAKAIWLFLTTEWLLWLQTNQRDSCYERFALVWRSNCIRHHIHHTTTIHWQPSEHWWGNHLLPLMIRSMKGPYSNFEVDL